MKRIPRLKTLPLRARSTDCFPRTTGLTGEGSRRETEEFTHCPTGCGGMAIVRNGAQARGRQRDIGVGTGRG